jgi:ABC-type multidrug transport system fused ATPase/permease subunit
LTSPFGRRPAPGDGGSTDHKGQDFGAPIGTPIMGVGAGTVIAAGPAAGYGNWVKIQHGPDIVSLYGHVSVVLVRTGQVVTANGQVTAVNGITFEVQPGQVLGLLGGNGAGKSSTLRAIAAVNPPTSGTVCVAGFDLTDPRQVDKARQVTGFCPDVGGLIQAATPREHIAATWLSAG